MRAQHHGKVAQRCKENAREKQCIPTGPLRQADKETKAVRQEERERVRERSRERERKKAVSDSGVASGQEIAIQNVEKHG